MMIEVLCIMLFFGLFAFNFYCFRFLRNFLTNEFKNLQKEFGGEISNIKEQIESIKNEINEVRVENDEVFAILSSKFENAISITQISEKNARLSEKNAKMTAKHKEYAQMLSIIFDVLQEDTEWIRSSFFQRFGSVPEYEAINSEIITFQTKIQQIKNTLRELKMIDEFGNE